MSNSSPHKILGIDPGATEAQIKAAYRKLAKKYHPDKNDSPQAAKKFQALTQAYEELLKRRPQPYQRDRNYENAAEIIRQETRKAREKIRKEQRAQKEKEEKFLQSEIYDLLLLLKYIFNGLVLIFSFAAIIFPFVLAIIIEPIVLVATFYFVIIGGFLIWYIYGRRKTWFKLGKFNFTKKKFREIFSKPASHSTNDFCCYMAKKKADGKAYQIKLIKVIDIKYASRGALDHNASFKQKAKILNLARCTRAERFHRTTTIIKILTLIAFICFFPVSSIFWRFLLGLFCAITISTLLLWIARVKPKTSFLLTPALLIKSAIWIVAILSISKIGPGFDISLSNYKFIVFAGLLFFLDMLFDLVLGLFPFYKNLFKPLAKQGNTISELYKLGYQNYIEYPVYSIIHPFFKWIY